MKKSGWDNIYEKCKEILYILDDLEIMGFDKYKVLNVVMTEDEILSDDDLTPEEKTEYMRKQQIHKKFCT